MIPTLRGVAAARAPGKKARPAAAAPRKRRRLMRRLFRQLISRLITGIPLYGDYRKISHPCALRTPFRASLSRLASIPLSPAFYKVNSPSRPLRINNAAKTISMTRASQVGILRPRGWGCPSVKRLLENAYARAKRPITTLVTATNRLLSGSPTQGKITTQLAIITPETQPSMTLIVRTSIGSRSLRRRGLHLTDAKARQSTRCRPSVRANQKTKLSFLASILAKSTPGTFFRSSIDLKSPCSLR